MRTRERAQESLCVVHATAGVETERRERSRPAVGEVEQLKEGHGMPQSIHIAVRSTCSTKGEDDEPLRHAYQSLPVKETDRQIEG